MQIKHRNPLDVVPLDDQRSEAHRRRMADKLARYEAALREIADLPGVSGYGLWWAIRAARTALGDGK